MISRYLGILLAACVALLAFSFKNALADLFTAWQSDEYSHGVIIPFLAALIGWHRLAEKRPALRPSLLGLIPLLAAGTFLLVSELAAFQTAAHYGFILALAGLSLSFLGTAVTRVLRPAFVYLLFAVPLPHLLYSSLSQDLQLLSSTLGVWFLQAVGISVFQEGNIIDLGSYKLQVVEACSGLRYLFPLMSFGYLIAYLLDDRMWKRAAVFLSTIPITLGMNSLRIAIIGITVNLWGAGMAEGLLHDFEGWVVFMLCVALLMAEVSLLLRVEPHGHFRFEIFSLPRGKLFTGSLHAAPSIWAAALACLILSVVFGAGLIHERGQIIPPHPPFNSFPVHIHEWRGEPSSLDPEVLAGLQLSEYWLADYYTQGSRVPVNFYIAYYDTQRVGSTTHSPSSCIPGGGWRIVSRSVKTVALSDGAALDVSRFIIRRAGLSQIVYFWFDERGRNITDTQYAKWYLLVDSIRLHRTDGALIRMVTPIAEGEKEDEAEKRLTGFLSAAHPLIAAFVPGATLPSSFPTPTR